MIIPKNVHSICKFSNPTQVDDCLKIGNAKMGVMLSEVSGGKMSLLFLSSHTVRRVLPLCKGSESCPDSSSSILLSQPPTITSINVIIRNGLPSIKFIIFQDKYLGIKRKEVIILARGKIETDK